MSKREPLLNRLYITVAVGWVNAERITKAIVPAFSASPTNVPHSLNNYQIKPLLVFHRLAFRRFQKPNGFHHNIQQLTSCVTSNPLYPTYNNSTNLLHRQRNLLYSRRLGRADTIRNKPLSCQPIHRPNFRAIRPWQCSGAKPNVFRCHNIPNKFRHHCTVPNPKLAFSCFNRSVVDVRRLAPGTSQKHSTADCSVRRPGCVHSSCRLGRADNSKTVPAPIHRPNFRAMTLAMFAERNPTFLKPPAFPTNSDTIARFQILNLPFHVSIALLLMFADWLPGHLKNIQPLIVRSAARDACIVFVGWVGIKVAIN